MTRGLFPALLVASTAITLVFLGLPVVAIFLSISPGELISSLGDGAAIDALRLSLFTSLAALLLILAFGTPTAWLLATRRFRGRSAAITIVELPLIVPPAVAGIGLLAALGPNGLAGGLLDDAGIRLVLETSGVIVALTFVSSPFYVRQAVAAFESLDSRMLEASRSLGASEARTLLRVALPLARPALIAGAALAWGRAIGEFGATLVFAGSFRNVTQTAPLAIYERFSTDFNSALALSAVLVLAGGGILLGVKLFGEARAR